MSEDKDTFTSVLLPIICKAMPTMLAEQIVSVQPMTGSTGQIFTMKGGIGFTPFTIVESSTPGWVALTVSNDVYAWLKEFSADQWRNADDKHLNSWSNAVIVTEELFTLLALKWSEE